MTFEIIKNTTLNCELKYVLDQYNEIWFRGKTVAEILGYKDQINALKSHVDNDDKCKFKALSIGGDLPPNLPPINYRVKNATIINESGLYSLILSSKLKTAKAFKKWVTKDVLPSIRKTGSYDIMEETDDVQLEITKDITNIEKVTKIITSLNVSPKLQEQLKETMYDEYVSNDTVNDTYSIVVSIQKQLNRMHTLNLPSKVTNKLLDKLEKQFIKECKQLKRVYDSDSESDDCCNWIGNYE